MSEETLEEFKERITKEYRPMYFDRQGKELLLMDWAKKCVEVDYKFVRQEPVGKYLVSTVWIGLNMRFLQKDLPPLIFETMIFIEGENEQNEEKDDLYLYQERYSTEEEAIKGHEIAVKLARNKIYE